jgi:hypothetical protein
MRLAHRASWELHYGPIAGRQQVHHVCDNPSCVHPDHLMLGNDRTKMQLCAERGRTTQGERSSSAKLTEEQVRQIRQRYAAGGISQQKLAEEYGLKQAALGELIRRETWRHVP